MRRTSVDLSRSCCKAYRKRRHSAVNSQPQDKQARTPGRLGPVFVIPGRKIGIQPGFWSVLVHPTAPFGRSASRNFESEAPSGSDSSGGWRRPQRHEQAHRRRRHLERWRGTPRAPRSCFVRCVAMPRRSLDKNRASRSAPSTENADPSKKIGFIEPRRSGALADSSLSRRASIRAALMDMRGP